MVRRWPKRRYATHTCTVWTCSTLTRDGIHADRLLKPFCQSDCKHIHSDPNIAQPSIAAHGIIHYYSVFQVTSGLYIPSKTAVYKQWRYIEVRQLLIPGSILVILEILPRKRRTAWIYISLLLVLRFSAPVQTGPEAHPASDAMGTGSFPEIKRPGCGVDHPPPFSAEVKETVELHLYSSSGPSWPVLGWILPLPLTLLLISTNVCKISILQMATRLRHLLLASTPVLKLRAATSNRVFPFYLLSPIRCRKAQTSYIATMSQNTVSSNRFPFSVHIVLRDGMKWWEQRKNRHNAAR